MLTRVRKRIKLKLFPSFGFHFSLPYNKMSVESLGKLGAVYRLMYIVEGDVCFLRKRTVYSS